MATARVLSQLAMRHGGLGMRSASRGAQAAYWASWADALPMIHQRTPAVAEMVVARLAQPNARAEGDPPSGCLEELHQACTRLDTDGFRERPSWEALRDGARPPEPLEREPGEWQHGWQYVASSHSDTHFRRTSLLASHAAPDRAHLRSHSGRNAGSTFSGAPTAREFTVAAHQFRTLLLERLRLPLPLTEASCEGCGSVLDALGRHRASCPVTGRLRIRAGPVERTLARIFREAGARVRFNAFLRDMNIGVPAGDGRRIEVLAQDLPCFGGASWQWTPRCAVP